MAIVPLSATVIRLMSGVPFHNDYKHTRWFTSALEQTSYFTSKPIVYQNTAMNFQKIEGKHYVAINLGIDSLHGTNYLMFQNEQYNAKWFYAFVTKLEYKNKSTTHVHFELDVLQTWRFDMTFKPSYVVREHRKLWESDGSPVINTIDEGLAYGSDLDNKLMSRVNAGTGTYKWFVIVAKQPIESGASKKIKSSVIGMPQPLSYYVVPFNDSNENPNIRIGASSDTVPITPLVSLTEGTGLLDALYSDDKAINNIVSLYVSDYIGFNVTYSSGNPDIITFPTSSNAKVVGVTVGDTNARVLRVDEVKTFHLKEVEITPDKYSAFTKPKESKLLMYPYTQLFFDDFRGTRVPFKLEYIDGKALKVLIKGSLGTSNQVSYGIPNYNATDTTDDNRRSNESALISNPPNDVPIMNDMLGAFLQGNRNSIQNQKAQINNERVYSALGSTISGVASATNKNPLGVASSAVHIAKGLSSANLQMQGIQAKQDDVANIPPQISKMGSNNAYDFGNGYNGLFIVRKQIKPEYQKILSDYFGMFGYKTNEVKIPNFRTRQHFNYVETLSCTITGDFNNEDLVELKNIFDSGITLWHVDDIGNYTLENGVR